MKITLLDASTLGDDLELSGFSKYGETVIYGLTSPEELAVRIADTDIIVVNKVKLNRTNLPQAKRLKLICLAATGYDNIDIEYCREAGIQVCNIVGYSTDSVAQTTCATVLELSTHIREYSEFVKNGSYTASGMANRVTPVYRELAGKTWGIIGLGNIGKKVATIAKAFGCRVIACKRSPDAEYECVDIDRLCESADIISIHTPLTEQTRSMIGERELSKMKRNVILYNAARGAVTDENAVARAVLDGKIGAFGCDVYSVEPFGEDHPFQLIKSLSNVCLTPHMAWGSYEARTRCISEILLNIDAFINGTKRNALISPTFFENER